MMRSEANRHWRRAKKVALNSKDVWTTIILSKRREAGELDCLYFFILIKEKYENGQFRYGAT